MIECIQNRDLMLRNKLNLKAYGLYRKNYEELNEYQKLTVRKLLKFNNS